MMLLFTLTTFKLHLIEALAVNVEGWFDNLPRPDLLLREIVFATFKTPSIRPKV